VTIIPIIYGISEQDFVNTKIEEGEERLIIDNIKECVEVAIFGDKICKSPLSKYGVI
jgi:hypothetical protein